MMTLTPLPFCSHPPKKMASIPCAFAGNIHRVDVCQGTAVVFFKTAKGTIWPFCQGCATRHKETAVQLVASQTIEVLDAVGAAFDIPIDDEETLAAFKAQDPKRIQRVIQLADAPFRSRK